MLGSERWDPSDGPRALRVEWSERFARDGWACDVGVLGSNLSVSFMREHIAACAQLGNVARTYADLMKLQALFRADTISMGVMIVPDDEWSRALGSNHASFSRLSRDVDLFERVIDVPLLLVAVNAGV